MTPCCCQPLTHTTLRKIHAEVEELQTQSLILTMLNSQTFQWGPLRPADDPYPSDNLSLGPRFGFAYTMGNSGDFVLRGGVDLDLMTAAQAIEQLDGVVSNPAPDGG